MPRLRRPTIDLQVATLSFGLAAAAGLVSAFLGLSVSSLWQDELYTSWIVDPAIGWSGMLGRALHDVSPPLYYVVVWPFVQVLGDWEVGLRLPSALAAVAAILLLVVAGRRFFSLRARLFAAAMATGSPYWFAQAQNARFYALALLLSTAMMLLAFGAIERRRGALAGLFAVTLIASFTHFYLFFESCAVLIMLALCLPDARAKARVGGWGALLLVLILLYVKFVVEQQSFASTGPNWIPNTVPWYREQLAAALRASLTHKAMAAVAVVMVLALASTLSRSRQPAFGSAGPAKLALCIGVPLGIFAAGMLSSQVATPNFHARYLLVGAPFFWALLALAYDFGVERWPQPMRAGGLVLLSVAVLAMAATLLPQRWLLSSEPFREAAAEIAAFPDCRDAVVPAVANEHRRWFRSAEGQEPVRAAHAKYLRGYARAELMFREDLQSGQLPDEWKLLLQRRIDGKDACPVLAWAVHDVSREAGVEIGDQLLKAVDRSGARDRLGMTVVRDGMEGWILYIKR